MSDKLLARLQGGSEEAFDELYEATHAAVFNIVLGVVRDYHTAQDVSQEVYVKIYEKRALYKVGTNAKAWIYTVARNTAVDRLRRGKNDVPTDFGERDDFVSSLPTPEEVVDTPLTDLAVKVLDEDEFEIIMLCDVNGYKRREVAEMKGMPLPTVTWKRNKALKTLKKYLQGDETNEKQ